MTIRRSTLAACVALLGAAAPAADPVAVRVTVASKLGEHQSGRLIVFVAPAVPDVRLDDPVDFSPFAPTSASIAAREVGDLSPGGIAQVDSEADAYRAPLSSLPVGAYRVQAVLDRNHDYNYAGRSEGDLVSAVMTATLPGPVPTLTLDQRVAAMDDATMLATAPPANRRS